LTSLCFIPPLSLLSDAERSVAIVGVAVLALPFGDLPTVARVTQAVLRCAVASFFAVALACRGFPMLSKRWLPAAILLLTLGGASYIALKALVLGGAEPLRWVLRFTIRDTWGWALGIYWVACFGILFLLLGPENQTWIRRRIAAINVRKLFHFLAIAMFLPGTILEPRFMGLAFAVGVTGLLALEALRFNRLPIGWKAIDAFMRRFTDEREASGHTVIRTHLYLVVGCAIPVWHTNRLGPTHSSAIAPFAGLLILGVGDSVASFVGVRWGRTKWAQLLAPLRIRVPDPRKSVEGTAAAAAATTACALALQWALSPSPAHDRPLTVTVAILLTCLAEALLDDIDNLLLPLYLLALLHSH
jgi:dolichol kinase